MKMIQLRQFVYGAFASWQKPYRIISFRALKMLLKVFSKNMVRVVDKQYYRSTMPNLFSATIGPIFLQIR